MKYNLEKFLIVLYSNANLHFVITITIASMKYNSVIIQCITMMHLCKKGLSKSKFYFIIPNILSIGKVKFKRIIKKFKFPKSFCSKNISLF